MLFRSSKELNEMEMELDLLQEKLDDALEDRDYYKSELEDCE